MSRGVRAYRCGFHGAHFTPRVYVALGSDDEKGKQVVTGEALLLLGLAVPLVKTLMSPKIFAKMQVQVKVGRFFACMKSSYAHTCVTT